jgi:hypothetical protein
VGGKITRGGHHGDAAFLLILQFPVLAHGCLEHLEAVELGILPQQRLGQDAEKSSHFAAGVEGISALPGSLAKAVW